jgi:hypothetical protein
MSKKNIFNQIATALATSAAVSVAIAAYAPKARAFSLIQQDLYFGRNIAGGGEVSESQFQGFVDSEITPRFPAGLTIFDANGQFQDSTGTIIEEPSKVVSLIFEDTLNNETFINQIIGAYLEQFNQESVLTVVDEEIGVRFVESETETELFQNLLLLLGCLYLTLLRSPGN